MKWNESKSESKSEIKSWANVNVKVKVKVMQWKSRSSCGNESERGSESKLKSHGKV